MPMTAVNAVSPVVAAQGVTGDVALQPGTVVAARVVQVSPDNTVRISIGGQSLDVQTEVALQAGQTLQLAVSQTADGIRLAVVPQQIAAAATTDLAATLMTTLAASKAQLTAPEAIAVSTAAQSAVTQQTSLANLFANLGAATSLSNLPPKLQQAVAQVLAQRPPLDAQLTGGEVKTAFQQSGLFLEASLATAAPAQSAVPDMKAALIVLKQALTATLQTAQQPAAAVVTPAQTQAAAATLVQKPGPKSDPAPAASAEADVEQPGAAAKIVSAALGNAPQVAGKSAALLAPLLQEEAALPEAVLLTKAQPGAQQAEVLGARPQIPPPPLRGALPSAQPMMAPTLAPDAPLGQTVQHLLSDTDAAIARQVLHQLASLPDRADAAGVPRSDQAPPRWSFEIPFAMPQGTALAQFEIARDGGQGGEAQAAQKVWRARFSLDVEPAGPIHALVSLTGDKTSVRMWAERPATAAQLQAGTADLTHALIRARLQPGDIVVREGAPVQPVPASAGHFLDRAS